MPNLFKKLKQPFPTEKVSFRVGAMTKTKDKAIALAYIDARDVMDRLDDVVGEGNWQAKYPFEGCCELSIYVNDSWVTKANCAGETKVEGEKGQASDAFKRAAVLWGIGRYLYECPNNWYEVDQYKKFTKDALKKIKSDFSAFTMVTFIDKDELKEHSSNIHAALVSDDLDIASGVWHDLTEIEQSVMWKAGHYFTEETKTIIRSFKPE